MLLKIFLNEHFSVKWFSQFFLFIFIVTVIIMKHKCIFLFFGKNQAL